MTPALILYQKVVATKRMLLVLSIVSIAVTISKECLRFWFVTMLSLNLTHSKLLISFENQMHDNQICSDF